eukprot:11035182-Alexandrium_andersonii.AAC.1
MGEGGPPPKRLTGPSHSRPKRAPCQWRRCICTATWGAAKQRPESLCPMALAHSAPPVWGRL